MKEPSAFRHIFDVRNVVFQMKENSVKIEYQITKDLRQKQNQHRAFLVWFTGLSGSGKSSIANAIESVLFNKNIRTYTLDGDNVRAGLNNDLGFSLEDRSENMRRVAEVAKLMIDSGTVVLAAFISPTLASRKMVSDIVGVENIVEVYVSTSLETCEHRDVKGLYNKARKGEISDMTGISSPYEAPLNPQLIIDTENKSIEESAKEVLKLIQQKLAL